MGQQCTELTASDPPKQVTLSLAVDASAFHHRSLRPSHLEPTTPPVAKRLQPSSHVPLWAAVVCGAVAGTTAAFVANPCDVALIRMQSDAHWEGENRRNYRHAFHAISSIARSEGAGVLWRGCGPTVVRGACARCGRRACVRVRVCVCVRRHRSPYEVRFAHLIHAHTCPLVALTVVRHPPRTATVYCLYVGFLITSTQQPTFHISKGMLLSLDERCESDGNVGSASGTVSSGTILATGAQQRWFKDGAADPKLHLLSSISAAVMAAVATCPIDTIKVL